MGSLNAEQRQARQHENAPESDSLATIRPGSGQKLYTHVPMHEI